MSRGQAARVSGKRPRAQFPPCPRVEHLGSCVLGDRRVPCWKVYLRIDRAYGLAGNKVGKVCSRKSFGRQGKFLAVLPAVSFQALLDYAVPGKIGRELEEYGEVLVAAQEAARVTELLRALLGRKKGKPCEERSLRKLGNLAAFAHFFGPKESGDQKRSGDKDR